jgi:hypothetical protein
MLVSGSPSTFFYAFLQILQIPYARIWPPGGRGASLSIDPEIFARALVHALAARYHGCAMPHIRIEMKPQGAETWDLLGDFSTDTAEMAALRSVLARHANPFDALKELPRGLIYDTLDVCRLEGHEVRLAFHD